MNRSIIRMFSLAVLSVSLMGSLLGCAKTKPLKSMVDPDAYVAKSDFEGKTFSLVRGVEEADSNNVVGAIPGFSEDYGFVEVRITESELQLIQTFNPANKKETQSIIASYAIKSHFDIIREENDFKEKTHRIVENRERPWNQRKFMRVDWTKPTNERSALATSTQNADVPVENVTLIEGLKNEAGHLSWLTEFSVAGGKHWWGVENNSRVVARTHLMPIKASDFERVNYRNQDFQRFGYFVNQHSVENLEKGYLDSELEANTFANLHNVCEAGRKDANGRLLSCSTNQVVWHLSKNFPEKYRDLARRAVKEWNVTFKEALGRTDDVIILDESKEVEVVDPRYNTIVHYGAKSPGGLLGVAQWASNPKTGELISVRATVYEDGIRGTLGWVDDIISLILSDDGVRETFLATDAETRARVEQIFRRSGKFRVQDDVKGAGAELRRVLGVDSRVETRQQETRQQETRQQEKLSTAASASVRAGISNALPKASQARYRIPEFHRKASEPAAKALARKANLMTKASGLFATEEGGKLAGSLAGFDETFGLIGAVGKDGPIASRLPKINGIEHLHDIGHSLNEERKRMVNQAYTGLHGAELVEEAALRYIKKILAQHPEAKDFAAQVSAIKTEIDRLTFYTTLLHEMGHTFGLRHNFHASADEQHYHPEFHRLKKQMEAEAGLAPAKRTVTPEDLDPYMYSSIMDYGGDFYSQAGGLGSYDKAAIKYAYNRSIDREKDQVVKAGYKFCTDHQVNDSILCRRFDKGRNASEITFNLIEDYHTNWVLSHNRRDRAMFDARARSYPMNALVRYFVPVRQAMDEFLYALIVAGSVPAKEGECDIDYWRASVDSGEVANVCDQVSAEIAGVDPTDLATFEQGLFTEQGLRKSPVEYKPYGLADLLFANLLAKQFFTDVLGSTEPGRYFAAPVDQNVFELEPVPAGADETEFVTEFLTARGVPASPDLVEQFKGLIGDVKEGRYGKPFQSEYDESGPYARQQNIGAFWDKYVAMIALGLKDIGVQKYYRRSMTGNAYVYPQTTDFAREIIQAMIVQNKKLVSVPFETKLGVLNANVAPSLNLDIRAIATITALTDFVSDSDESIADRLRVCSVDEAGCRAAFGSDVVEFTTASGQDVFRTVQTLEGDSIAFELLSEAAALDKQRKEWVDKLQKASDSTIDNIMKIEALGDQLPVMMSALKEADVEALKEILPLFVSDNPSQATMWSIMQMLATQGEQIPLFITLNQANQVFGILGATAQALVESIAAVDPAGQCPEPENVSQPVDANRDENAPT
ncbi:MAG: zinc-dependent metalloprotease, partial [Bdellovibrionales bacterium]|nr:zinc-dependent metalloprotease [Bdellovibrionales bacterium]